MPSRCVVKVNQHERGYYTPGQVITGRIELHLDKPKRISSFVVYFYGEARIYFTEGCYSKTRYSGSEQIFRYEIQVMPRSNGPYDLPAGSIGYSFDYKLPDRVCPSSLSCDIGKAVYYAFAVVDKSWSFLSYTDKAYFIIRNEWDLNQRASLIRKPFRKEIFTGNPSSVRFIVELPVTGFVPGEIIPITVTVHIDSNHRAHSVKSRLIQKVTVQATTITSSPVNKVNEEIQNVAFTWIPEVKNYKCTQHMKVPSIPPSELMPIWNVEYILETSLDIEPRYSSNPTMQIPITIGTIPFR